MHLTLFDNELWLQVRNIYLHPKLLSIEDGLLTPTLKTKRLECRKLFKPQIDAMYSHLM